MSNISDNQRFSCFSFYYLLKSFHLGGYVYDTILETLRPFGITRCYKGFPLTVYAIHLAVMEEDRLEEITEKIYRETADHFGCKWTAVERNLRTVVSRAWQVNPDLLCRMAGYPLTAAPTASEFIEIIASYIIRSRQTS